MRITRLSYVIGFLRPSLALALTAVLVSVQVLAGCSAPQQIAGSTPPAPTNTIAGDYWPTKGWRTSTPEEQQMDSAELNKMLEFIGTSGRGVDSVLVVRHGYVVFEQYRNPLYDSQMSHIIHSITKSVVTTIVGVALQRGNLKSLDQKMVDFFPDMTIQNLDARKTSITLKDMLLMKSGIKWDERSYSYSDERSSAVQMSRSGNRVQYTLDQEMAADPGTVWTYNGGTSNVMTAIISRATKSDTFDYARKYLFDPMGIAAGDEDWPKDMYGNRQGDGGLHLTTPDLAKLGYLYMKNGVWEGQQLIPAELAINAPKTITSFDAAHGYGYQSWWTYPLSNISYMAGLDGQRVYIAPDLDVIVVFTSYIPEAENPEKPLAGALEYVIRACK